jgi:hypothetical protein
MLDDRRDARRRLGMIGGVRGLMREMIVIQAESSYAAFRRIRRRRRWVVARDCRISSPSRRHRIKQDNFERE